MKLFITSRMTKTDLRQAICKSAKKLGVNKVIFNAKAKRINGSYNALTSVIFLDAKLTKKEMLKTFFHELGHHVAVKQHKWKSYHFDIGPRISKEKVFEIENKIDRIGNKLWNKYVSTKQWGRYSFAYPFKHKKNLIKTFINS